MGDTASGGFGSSFSGGMQPMGGASIYNAQSAGTGQPLVTSNIAGGGGNGGAAKAKAPAPTTTAATPAPSPLPNQQVAPLTQQQQQAMNSVSQQAGSSQNFLNQAEGEQAQTIAGQGLAPNNPYLADYFNAAAQPLTQQFEQATAPNILANAASTGTVGSAGMKQAFGNAETSLAQGLGNLGAGIYEPAYAQGVQNQQNAAQNAPNLASGQFIPSSQLSASGQIGQNQAQNVLSTQYQNLLGQANYPMQELNQLGAALGLASGGGGNTVSIGTSPAGSSGGK